MTYGPEGTLLHHHRKLVPTDTERLVCGPDGADVTEPVFDVAAILIADLDLGRIREESMTLDVAGHYARPDCFEFRTVPHGRRDAPLSSAQR